MQASVHRHSTGPDSCTLLGRSLELGSRRVETHSTATTLLGLNGFIYQRSSKARVFSSHSCGTRRARTYVILTPVRY